MSWFSLSARGKEIFNTHSTVSGICTGSIAGSYLFKTVVQPSYLHTQLRNATATTVSRLLAPRLESFHIQASEHLMHMSLTKGKLKHLTGKLKESFMQDPKEYLRLAGKIGARFVQRTAKKCMKKMDMRKSNKDQFPSDQQSENDVPAEAKVEPSRENLRFLPGKYTPEQAKQIKSLMKQGEIKEAIYHATFFNLKPTCDSAIQKTMNGMVKTGAGNACDFIVKKALTVACLPTLYAMALITLQWTAKQCGDETYGQLMNAAEVVPSPYTILTLSALGNAVQMTHAVWQAARQASRGDHHDNDKEEVKQIVLKHVKESVRKKLMGNQLLSEIGFTEDPQRVNTLVEALVFEAVDLYWEDLHSKKILGLPLVS